MKEAQDIFVIDDEPAVTQAVAKICRAEGMTVAVSGLASEALEKLAKQSFRLVLCDIMLPELNGFEFLDALAGKGIHAPVVMMTGYSTVENAVRSLTATGGLDYIPKPFTADELLAVIRRSLRCSALLDEADSACLPGNGALPFVPCPADFHKLGYVSWVRMEDEGSARIGVSDLFLKAVEGLSALELSPPGEEVLQGIPCATAISMDNSAHDIMCPLSGQVLETNTAAQSAPSLVEKDPYFRGWLYRILPSNLQSDMRWLGH